MTLATERSESKSVYGKSRRYSYRNKEVMIASVLVNMEPADAAQTLKSRIIIRIVLPRQGSRNKEVMKAAALVNMESADATQTLKSKVKIKTSIHG